MSETSAHVAPLDAADFGALSLVATAAYAQAYSHLWADPARLSQRLGRFAPEALRAWAAEPGVRIWTAKSGPAILGYLGLRLRSPDPVDGEPTAAEVHRIYLLSAAGRRGLGRALMAEAEAEARREGAPTLWLKSMAEGPARAAYDRLGFRHVGDARLDNDIVELSPMVVLLKALRS